MRFRTSVRMILGLAAAGGAVLAFSGTAAAADSSLPSVVPQPTQSVGAAPNKGSVTNVTNDSSGSTTQVNSVQNSNTTTTGPSDNSNNPNPPQAQPPADNS